MDGSSSTYSTPVVRFLTARASCIRWRSPVDRVEAALSRVRYPSPRSIRRFAAVSNDSQMLSAIGLISAGSEQGTAATQSTSSSRLILQASSSVILQSFGFIAFSESLVP